MKFHDEIFRGFITYRENALIYEENPDDIAHVQRMTGVRVIAHEM